MSREKKIQLPTESEARRCVLIVAENHLGIIEKIVSENGFDYAVVLPYTHDYQLFIDHARIQGEANGFQDGWHAALERLRQGDSVHDLAKLVPRRGGSSV